MENSLENVWENHGLSLIFSDEESRPNDFVLCVVSLMKVDRRDVVRGYGFDDFPCRDPVLGPSWLEIGESDRLPDLADRRVRRYTSWSVLCYGHESDVARAWTSRGRIWNGDGER